MGDTREGDHGMNSEGASGGRGLTGSEFGGREAHNERNWRDGAHQERFWRKMPQRGNQDGKDQSAGGGQGRRGGQSVGSQGRREGQSVGRRAKGGVGRREGQGRREGVSRSERRPREGRGGQSVGGSVQGMTEGSLSKFRMDEIFFVRCK
jgi:hypothetical protein